MSGLHVRFLQLRILFLIVLFFFAFPCVCLLFKKNAFLVSLPISSATMAMCGFEKGKKRKKSNSTQKKSRG